MFAVAVTFMVKPGRMPDFLPLVLQQAKNSLALEEQCRQFDVCTGGDNEHEVFLYELYDDKAAFDAHLASAHFANFSAASADLLDSKLIKTYSIVAQ